LSVLFVWKIIGDYYNTAEKEVVETIIKNTDFNLDNIESFLFNTHKNVIEKLNKIIKHPKNKFRKARIEYFFDCYLDSIPITYEINLHIIPNYKKLFDNYHKIKSQDPHSKLRDYPKKENNRNFYCDENENYEEKLNPRIIIIGNSINEFTQCFINGKYF
jgi:hypothetical protein